ncbi:hypothetical protein [Nonomuraea harbinensis]|uniref:Uncharacterized protein n=1 Tax=Nonomuraea harbinensis TaxID=1286938 RepID=A0ABW1C5N2_9ACTN|nr:hypothetical protein [Nonomuraea harbinensis]
MTGFGRLDGEGQPGDELGTGPLVTGSSLTGSVVVGDVIQIQGVGGTLAITFRGPVYRVEAFPPPRDRPRVEQARAALPAVAGPEI